MISWIQNTFEKHFKVLFLLLLGGVIISFVFTIGEMPGCSGATVRQVQKRDFFGMNLNSNEVQQQIFGDASLSVQLQTGTNSLDSARLQQYALSRQASLVLANELGLPAPTNEQIGQYIRSLAFFRDDKGQFDPKKYDEFRDSLQTNPRLTETDVGRVLTNDVTYHEVSRLLGGPGYVLPQDVAEQLSLTDSTWSIEVASIDTSAFKPAITLSDDMIADYFKKNSGRYEIPAETRVDYIRFAADPASVVVDEKDLLADYLADPSRFPVPQADPDKKDADAQASAFDNFAKVKPQVEAYFRHQKALRSAVQTASDFAYFLFENKVTPDALPELLKSRKLTLSQAPAFAAANPPAELAGVQQLDSAVSRIDAERPYSDALAGPNGAVILIWRESIPARHPELAEVRAQVEADLRNARRQEQLAEASATFRDSIESQLKAQTSFADAVKTAAQTAGFSVENKSFADFTFTTLPQGLDYSVINAIQNLSNGDLSPIVTTGDNQSILAYVTDKKLPDLTPANPRFQEIRDRIAGILSSSNGDSILASIASAELAKTAPASPAE